MTLAEVADTLPWGLHDAYLEALDIDWLAARLTLTVRVMITVHQDMDQRARIVVDGLVFCSIEPPEIDPAKGYTPIPEGGLWVSDGTGAAEAGVMALPATPDGCFPALVLRRPVEPIHARLRQGSAAGMARTCARRRARRAESVVAG